MEPPHWPQMAVYHRLSRLGVLWGLGRDTLARRSARRGTHLGFTASPAAGTRDYGTRLFKAPFGPQHPAQPLSRATDPRADER